MDICFFFTAHLLNGLDLNYYKITRRLNAGQGLYLKTSSTKRENVVADCGNFRARVKDTNSLKGFIFASNLPWMSHSNYSSSLLWAMTTLSHLKDTFCGVIKS